MSRGLVGWRSWSVAKIRSITPIIRSFGRFQSELMASASSGTGSLPHHNVPFVGIEFEVLPASINWASYNRLLSSTDRGHWEVQADISISGVDVEVCGETW